MFFSDSLLSDPCKAHQAHRQQPSTEQGWHFKERMMIGCLPVRYGKKMLLWKVQRKFQSISLIFRHVVLCTKFFHVARHESNYVEVANAKSLKDEFRILTLQSQISVDTSHQEGHLFHLNSWHKYCSFMNKLLLQKWCSPQVGERIAFTFPVTKWICIFDRHFRNSFLAGCKKL